jgi:amidase
MDDDIEPDRRSVLKIGAAFAGAMAAGSQASATPYEPPQIVRWSAVELAQAIRARRVSCAEVMAAYLDHIAVMNPRVNAIVALQDRDELMGEARQRDAALARGEAVGPLHGFPHAVKDLQAVKGIRSTSGSPILRDFVPTADSLQVERLRRAGVVIIGKTNTPEFGLGSHTFNEVYGTTRNPYDLSRSAGGSTGGGAVALALRMAPLADGSDYGGSLRNPAGWNNVVGFRTSIGRVPSDAKDAWLPSMSVNGPMARSVGDLALLLSVMAGYDPSAPLSMESPGSIFAEAPRPAAKGARIGWLGDFGGHAPCEPGVLDVCRSALKTFEDIGCHVEDAAPAHDPDAAWRAFVALRGWQQGAGLKAFYDDPARRPRLKPEAVYEVETGLKLSAYDVTAASVERTAWSEAVRRLFGRFDFLIAPTAQVFPFEAAQRWPGEIDGRTMQTYHEWMKGVCLVTLSGCPSLAVPAGFSAQGLPMGVQIIGPVHGELACLSLGAAYEAASGWTRRRPPPTLVTT